MNLSRKENIPPAVYARRRVRRWVSTETCLAPVAAIAFVFFLSLGIARAQESTPALAKEAVHFVDLLAKEDFGTAVQGFDQTMKQACPEAKLREIWSGVKQSVGAFKETAGTRQERFAGYDLEFVTCRFERATLDTKVVFNSRGEIAGLFFVPTQPSAAAAGPATYVRTNAFVEKAVVVGAGSEWPLKGTISLPKGEAKSVPGVVLVHGSGPLDMDETVGPNRPFRDLAWGLASDGVAVLRYEKRTMAHPAKVSAGRITVQEETIEDALKAVSLLRATEGIDAKRVYVLGHSLGAYLAPRIAAAEPGLAGLVMIAGPARPLEDLMVEQTKYLLGLGDPDQADASDRLAKLEKEVGRVKALTAADVTNRTKLLGAPPEYWLDLRSYDPLKVLLKLKLPVLFLQGERDYQVTMTDFSLWKKTAGSMPNCTFKSYPDLNHLFISGTGKSTPDEYLTAGHVSGTVVSDIVNWIRER